MPIDWNNEDTDFADNNMVWGVDIDEDGNSRDFGANFGIEIREQNNNLFDLSYWRDRSFRNWVQNPFREECVYKMLIFIAPFKLC